MSKLAALIKWLELHCSYWSCTALDYFQFVTIIKIGSKVLMYFPVHLKMRKERYIWQEERLFACKKVITLIVFCYFVSVSGFYSVCFKHKARKWMHSFPSSCGSCGNICLNLSLTVWFCFFFFSFSIIYVGLTYCLLGNISFSA